MAEEQKTEEAYKVIESIIDKAIEETPKGKVRRIGPNDIKDSIRKYAPEIQQAYTEGYEEQIDQLTEKNNNQRTTISALTTEVTKEKERYEETLTRMLEYVPDDILERQVYVREEESIAKAEAEDAEEADSED